MLVVDYLRSRKRQAGGFPVVRIGRHAKTIGVLLLVAVLMAPATPAPAGRGRALPPEIASPPGQINVITVNTKQLYAVDLKAFGRIFELVKAVRSRPDSFEGGSAKATGMPDVIIFQEMTIPNLEITQRLLNQRSRYRYEVAAVEGTTSKFLYNSNTLSLIGTPETWVDPCRSGVDGNPAKTYQYARFTETATSLPFIVAGVHFKAKYSETGAADCRERNVQVMRGILNVQGLPLIIGGDFNNRPMDAERECDPDERTAIRPWYQMMTQPEDGARPYVDAVRDFHRARGISMADEWTFEREIISTLCTGKEGFRRSRLDYLFTNGTVVAEGHADHPGWAREPGEVHVVRHRYSDHRWVFGRFVLANVPRPAPPDVSLDQGGIVDLRWEPMEGVTSWVIYRAFQNQPFRRLKTVTADLTTYEDSTADNGKTYRYAIAGVGPDGGQGRESIGTAAVPDARGPEVVAVSPAAGDQNASRFKSLRVWFNDRIDNDSITSATISMYQKKKRVAGRIRQESGRILVFNPNRALKKKATYWVVVRPVKDRLGNRGRRFGWGFRT